jgi:hypothetical protein
MLGIHRLLVDLKGIRRDVDGPLLSNNWQWLIVNKYDVFGGRFDGLVIRIAVPVLDDFPSTPPGGFYVSPKIVPAALMGALNVHDRQSETEKLPGEWQYWSRPIQPGTWQPANGARRLVAHWNTVMLNAN